LRPAETATQNAGKSFAIQINHVMTSRSKFFALIAGAALTPALAGTTLVPSGIQGSSVADTGYFQLTRKIASGVWVLAEPKFQVQPIGNVTVIEQSDGLVLVDAGGSPGAGRRIVAEVRSLSNKPVKAIFISQWHGDKVQGLSELLRAWPAARTIATAQTKAHLSDPRTMNTPAGPDAKRNADFVKAQRDVSVYMAKQAASATSDAERRGFADAARAFRQYALDVDGALTLSTRESFADRFSIADSVAPVEAMFLGPANTDGDAVIWLPKQRILIASETVVLPFPYGFESYPARWSGVLKKLRAMKFATLVPGHGMPQHDRGQVDRIIAAIESVRAQVAPLVAKGLSLAEVETKVDFSQQQKSFVGGDAWLGRWFREFWAKPIVESAYKEAKGEPIVQGFSR
jgi:glyoxylase-like metal-dependent hydrolase (beta-lactamase superfamily II)